MGADNLGERWRQALLDFAYGNIGFILKQLIAVLCCDLQVTIHEGLVEVQADIFKAIASFIDNFHIEVTTLSAPQVHALLDYMHARCAGSHSFLAAVWWGTTLMRPESFLQNSPTQLLQSFFDRLPDHQTDIERGSTHPTQLEIEVDLYSKVLQTCLVDITSDPALMLDFRCGIKNIPTINLTGKEAVLRYSLLKGNIAEDDPEVPTTALGHLSHQQTFHDESFSSVIPPHTGSGAAPATSSASALRIIPTALLATEKQEFSPQSIGRLKALMLRENRTQTLIKVGAEEASTRFDAHTFQDEASYDGSISDADEEDIEVVPDRVHDTQIKRSKPAEAYTVAGKEIPKATNKEDGGQTLKSMDKKPVHKCSNRASSGSQDVPVCCDRDILMDGQKDKYPKDHISIHCIQRTGRVLLMNCFGMLKEEQKMADIFFHTDVTLVDGSTLQGGEWPSVPWYPDTPETGAALQDLSWFIEICQGLFPRVCATQDFLYPRKLHLAHHIKLQKTSDIVPLWGAYVEYPCQQSGAHVLWPLA